MYLQMLERLRYLGERKLLSFADDLKKNSRAEAGVSVLPEGNTPENETKNVSHAHEHDAA